MALEDFVYSRSEASASTPGNQKGRLGLKTVPKTAVTAPDKAANENKKTTKTTASEEVADNIKKTIKTTASAASKKKKGGKR